MSAMIDTGGRAPGVRYPDHYAWFVLVACLDLILTNTVINRFGAVEVNPVAGHAIRLAGFWGLIALKFASVLVVIGVCEAIGRRREPTGRRLAGCAIAVSCLPVAAALLQVAARAGAV